MARTATLQEILDEGAQLLESRRVDQAQALADELISRLPDNPQVRYFASDVFSMRGDAIAAAAQLDAITGEAADIPRILLRKAELLQWQGRRRAALVPARAALAGVGTEERSITALARVFMESRAYDEAEACLLAAREQLPDSVPIRYLLALVQSELGRRDTAQDHLQWVLERAPGHPGALLLRSRQQRWSASRNNIETLTTCVDAAGSNLQLLAVANYALGKEHEDLGDADSAMGAFTVAADAYRRTLAYDEQTELAAQADIRERLDAARLAGLGSGCNDGSPIFLVGLPQVGASLLGELLSAHADVAPLGASGDFKRLLGMAAGAAAPTEPSDAEACLAVDFARLGADYLSCATENVGAQRRFLDTSLSNFLYLGYIFAALPRARVIHLSRDPLDHAYSLYKTLFLGAQSYSYDLNELAAYYASYRAQMAHWHSLFPGQILELSYEDLVVDFPTQLRRVRDYCGLAGDRDNGGAGDHGALGKLRESLHQRSIGRGHHQGDTFLRLQEVFGTAGLSGA